MNRTRIQYYLEVILIASYICISNSNVSANVILPAMFSDNMVLQQKDRVPIWGKTEANKKVIISTSWKHKKYTAIADSEGNWKVAVTTPSAGGPYSITFNDGEILVLKNILIGEVWFCSGQSNMEMPLAGWGKINNYEQEISMANYPDIRLLQVEKTANTKPKKDVKVSNNGWQPCSPQTVAEFSAVAYFFAKNIYQNKHIPIGLIHSSWGGTIAEAWTSGTSLKKMSAFTSQVEALEKSTTTEEELQKKYNENLADWLLQAPKKDLGMDNGVAKWAATNLDLSDWKVTKLPTYWEYDSLANFDGVVWFRKKIIIPEGVTGQEMTLSLGGIDDNDITYINGTEIGRTDGRTKLRKYTIPGNLLNSGENILTVRITDIGGSGGMYDDPKLLFISSSDGRSIPLTGEWNYKVSRLPPVPKPGNGKNRPTVLYNAMVNPIMPYAIKGVIWYQGEGNYTRALQYRELFPLLIQDWRTKWGRGDFPFLFVQIANYTKRGSEPEESDWAKLREAQLRTLSVPNTGMAVTIDIGEEKDIHPKNKQDVGNRLALVARAKVYGENIPYSGPIYKSIKKLDNNNMQISFNHTDGGLKTNESDKLIGFAVAGSDKKFHWANAKIVGDKVLVWSDEVSDPIAVRYAWASNPACNLYNGAGLPASPFRSDEW